MYRMVQQVHIQITIQVVIKESRLGGESLKSQSPRFRLFTEGQIPLVDKELVCTFQSFVASHIANMDIQETIAVYIGHDHSCAPIARSCNP